MNKKGLAILLRTRINIMRPNNPLPSPLLNGVNNNNQILVAPSPQGGDDAAVAGEGSNKLDGSCARSFDVVRERMHSAISMNKTEVLDSMLNDFSQGYLSLSCENRRELLLVLAKGNDLNRTQVRELITQYLGLQPPDGNEVKSGVDEETMLSAFYRIERNLRQALKPTYEVLFDRLNNHPGGLKFLSILRADILSILEKENISSLRALDGYLKEKLSTWLSPAALELHQITWDYPASFLEKIVAYEAVHPISNLIDLKRRLGVGRRCFGYLHPAIPGEPLIFIEVALLKHVAQTIQEVLWDDPPIPESEASCALFYSISSTQPGLAGINLGKFLIKRVITLVKRDMPHISTFATLSPIPGYMQWLLSKLASQAMLAEIENMAQSSGSGSGSTFQENLLEPDEERLLMNCSRMSCKNVKKAAQSINFIKDPFLLLNINLLLFADGICCQMTTLCMGELVEGFDTDSDESRRQGLPVLNAKLSSYEDEAKNNCFMQQLLSIYNHSSNSRGASAAKNGMQVMLNLLTSSNSEWTHSDEVVSALKPPLMRLCARYLLQEKKRGKALDSVANFHLQNGAMVERVNWMADQSEKGLRQSGGIMVNYVYRLESIEEYAQSYFSSGYIHASCNIRRYVMVHPTA